MKQLLGILILFMVTGPAFGEKIETRRVPVLSHVAHPHSYYWREMYLPQLTSGPSGASYGPDGKMVIYSMQGSLWRQDIASDTAYQLTRGPGYDYQPDWSPDGRSVVFSRHNGDALNLVLLDLKTGQETALTTGRAVNVEPRWSPDGARIAFVSSRGEGYFGLYVADIRKQKMTDIRPLVAGRISERDRYYYSQADHAINPSWSPDGQRIYYVSNEEVAWGSGDIWSVAVDNPADRVRVLVEETTWSARPELARDGKRLLYSSYEGRQWHQLWLTTPQGLSPLPLTFGDFDLKMARWSPDGRHVLYTSNESGGLELWQQTVVGGARRKIAARNKIYKSPMVSLDIALQDERGRALSGRVMVLAADGRHYAPADSRIHADDYFDPKTSRHENHYFHCFESCTVMVPMGQVNIMAASGYSHKIAETGIRAEGEVVPVRLTLPEIGLPGEFGSHVSADMHVHMNYGGQYKQSLDGLAKQARAEGLDIVYNLIVNKEQRIPDISQFKTTPDRFGGVTIYQGQEFHTSFWGHLSFLHLDDHLLTPDFSSYRHTALASPYPSNAVVSDLAHAQEAVVGYVHPFDSVPDPAAPGRLSHSLPLDVIAGRADFLEIVSFANHQETANVWYKFLNLGYPLAAGAGTDAMTNYASLRGPVGMNRAYLQAEADSPASLKRAIKSGNGYVTNGPHLGLLAKHQNNPPVGPGSRIKLPERGGTLNLHLALQSFVPVERLEVVQNGEVIHNIDLAGNLYQADVRLEIPVTGSGWVLLRAVHETPHPFVQDVYTYATTNPIWIDVKNKPQSAPEDARYFLRWINRIRGHVEKRTDDFNTPWEKDVILDDIEKATKSLQEKLNAAL